METIFQAYSVQLLRESSGTYQLDLDFDVALNSAEEVVKAVNSVYNLQNLTQENIILLTVDTKLKCVGLHVVHIGGIRESVCNIPDIFKRVLLSNSGRFFLIHNHPSGDSTPSPEDFIATGRVLDASKVMNIDFVDHIVVGYNDHTSIRRNTNLWGDKD